MSEAFTQVTDFSISQIWLGEGNSERGCTFTVGQGGHRSEGMRAYFSDGRFVVDNGATDHVDELAEALRTDPHFPEVVHDYLQFGLRPSSYHTRLTA